MSALAENIDATGRHITKQNVQQNLNCVRACLGFYDYAHMLLSTHMVLCYQKRNMLDKIVLILHIMVYCRADITHDSGSNKRNRPHGMTPCICINSKTKCRARCDSLHFLPAPMAALYITTVGPTYLAPAGTQPPGKLSPTDCIGDRHPEQHHM